MRLDLIFSMKDIYINSNQNPLTKFTSSSRSTKFKDVLSWNISQMITKTIPISTRTVISCDETGHPVLYLLESQWKLRKQYDQKRKAIAEQILVSEEINKSESAGL